MRRPLLADQMSGSFKGKIERLSFFGYGTPTMLTTAFCICGFREPIPSVEYVAVFSRKQPRRKGSPGMKWLMLIGAIVLTASSFYASAANEPNSVAPPAPETRYSRLTLTGGVSIQVPSHWRVLSSEAKENLAAASEASVENAGVANTRESRNPVLAVSATPEPSGAIVRVTISTPAQFTSDQLLSISAADLKLGRENIMRSESPGGPKFLSVEVPHVEMIAGLPALAMPYRRAGLVGPSPWFVTLYRIPMKDRMIEVTLSYRESDKYLWQPILEKVKRSIRLVE